ncbi:MAG: PSD1 domain-containing protein [Verrucomicrobia bacterium]|nr:PSD1 domain-containing protein [Verrucomicrobiota bacterium]
MTRFFLALVPLSLAAQPAVDYLTEVKPLLAQHCCRCHGAAQQKGGLRVDTVAAMREGGDSGTLFAAGPVDGSLLLKVILGTHDEVAQMPYKKPPLAEAQIATIRRWVMQGAAAPAHEEPEKTRHWAFAAPERPLAPEVLDTAWPRNPIDRFVLARLEAGKIKPSREADPATLLRRVTLDLTGLPPTPAEVDQFLSDKSAGAYERAVDRLLASPRHGERWARPWLDVARYADSNGYSVDAPRQIWKYRDWVVAALNADLPYDQFVIEQLAGDLLPEPTAGQRVATGFNRNTQINQEGGIDPEQFRIEAVMDRVATFGTAFLGLTVSCAQCHDHKFDPISQQDYYRLFAFFNNSVDDGHGKTVSGGLLAFPREIEAPEGLMRELEEARAALESFLNTQGGAVTAWIATLDTPARVKFGATAREALKLPWDQLTLAHKRALYALMPDGAPEFAAANLRLQRLERREPRPITTLVMQELPQPRETVVFIKGDFTRPGERVTPGTPAALPPLAVANPNRLDLARWLFAPEHPLTARVMVNRLWQQYFGRGLVETENDFGTQGTPPSHPELLDWLATEFRERGWSLKALHRLIVTSATYRRSSHARPDLATSDPLNRLLARQTRLRLDAESIRDVALAASGLLSPKIGGPPVFPPQPDGVMTLGQVKRTWTPSTGEDRYRRALYTHWWRATPHPALAVFDAADGFTTCTRRLRSNTPLQALTLLNDPQFLELAEALGRRAESARGWSAAAKLSHAFRLCTAREPSAGERARLVAFFKQQTAPGGGGVRAAWTAVGRVLLNLDETITRE